MKDIAKAFKAIRAEKASTSKYVAEMAAKMQSDAEYAAKNKCCFDSIAAAAVDLEENTGYIAGLQFALDALTEEK
jgi:hypothetical protein